MDNATGTSRGFGFVEMADKFQAFDAIDNIDATYFEGNIISVKEAKQNNTRGGSSSGGNRSFNRPRTPRPGGGAYNREGGGYNRDRDNSGGYNRDRGGYNRDNGGGYNRDNSGGYNRDNGGYNRDSSYNRDSNYGNRSSSSNDDDRFNRL